MKTLFLIISLIGLVSCNPASTQAPIPVAAGSDDYWQNRVDSNPQIINYSVTNGGMKYYTSSNTLTDSSVFTIPEHIDIITDSLGTLHNDDYMELEIAGKILCRYYSMGNYFQFQSCANYNPAVTWTIRARQSYYLSDLNTNSILADKYKVNVVLRRADACTGSCNINGTIAFRYEL